MHMIGYSLKIRLLQMSLAFLAFMLVLKPISFPGRNNILTPANALAQQQVEIPSVESASFAYSGFYRTLKKFAGILLLIGCVLAGLCYVAGKKDYAVSLFIGAFIIFAGSYLLGIIANGFDKQSSSSATSSIADLSDSFIRQFQTVALPVNAGLSGTNGVSGVGTTNSVGGVIVASTGTLAEGTVVSPTSSWNAPQIRVIPVDKPVYISNGTVLEWSRSKEGYPLVKLQAQVNFPKFNTSTPQEGGLQTMQAVPMTVTQGVVFYPVKGGAQWIGKSGPLLVTLNNNGTQQKETLVSQNTGRAIWQSGIGKEGLYIDNFVGAALAIAKPDLEQRFTADEINYFNQCRGDAAFYLRRNPEAAKTN